MVYHDQWIQILSEHVRYRFRGEEYVSACLLPVDPIKKKEHVLEQRADIIADTMQSSPLILFLRYIPAHIQMLPLHG